MRFVYLTLACLLILLILFLIRVLVKKEYFNKDTEQQSLFQYQIADQSDPFIQPKMLLHFLTPHECDMVRELSSRQGFDASKIEDRVADSSIRTSETCWLQPEKHDLIKTIYKRVRELPEIKMMGEDVRMEELQVVRYNQGDFYKSHYDQCHENRPYCQQQLKDFSGPRKWTILIYLNDDYDGGETEFVALNRKIKGKKGDALLFHSLTTDNTRVHPLSLHQGTPVLSGQKWISNIWIRHKQYK